MPPPPPALPALPDPASLEFQKNFGLGAIHAEVPFAKGFTGEGITVAVIDTGANPAQADLIGAISPDSTDVFPGRNTPVGVNDHATLVSSVIAARYNGFGTIGVAYKSTILSIRADNTLGASCTKTCEFDDVETANGIEYAIAHGARVINMSLGGPDPDTFFFQRALADAVAAGVVLTISAGNDSAANPSFPARYAVDPRFAGSILAVGATNSAGAISSFSNRAGFVADEFLTAPGQSIIVDCDASGCFSVSGTSFSAPHAAGAIALLLQAFPNLTGKQAIAILLATADDMGAPGVDSDFGHGALNLTHAFDPVGVMSVQSVGGETVDAVVPPGTHLGQAFGGAFASGGELVTIGHDSFQRLFIIDLADAYRTSRTAGLIGVSPSTRSSSTTLALPGGAHLSVAGEAPLSPAIDAQATSAGFFMATDPSSATVAFDAGHLGLVAWNGHGGALPPEVSGPRDAFQDIASPDRLVAGAWRMGRWTLGAEQGWARRTEPFSVRSDAASSYLHVSAAFDSAQVHAQFAFGSLTEPLGPLGSNLPGRSAFAMPARTGFLSLSAQAPAGRFTAYGQASMGRTHFDGRFLSLDGAISSAWRLGLRSACGDIRRSCRHWTLELSQPLRLESGVVTANLAAVPARYFDPVTFTLRRLSAAPTGRQVDLSLFADQDLRRWGAVRVGVVAARNEGHIAGAPLAVRVLANWRVGF